MSIGDGPPISDRRHRAVTAGGELLDAVRDATGSTGARRLRDPARTLSDRYRSADTEDASRELSEVDVRAYAVTRLPATFAAVHAVLSEVRLRRPGFAPRSLLDVGAGPGTAMWAAASVFPSLERATLVEREPAMISFGERLAAGASEHLVAGADWVHGDAGEAAGLSADLVIASYVVGELGGHRRASAIASWWQAASRDLVLVDAGTPPGFERLRAARIQLIGLDAHVTAPCPHDDACPMSGGDWCHFAVRLPRTGLHRTAKDAERGFEDEKYAYVALTRDPPTDRPSRLLRSPHPHKGHVRLRLCEPTGVHDRVVSRRDGDRYKQARAARWGDGLEPRGPPG